MPIYEYQCSRCKNLFELFLKMGEDCEAVCPKCMAPARKLISAASFVLKGSGFYATDSKKPDNKPGKQYSEIAEELDKPKSDAKDNGKDKRTDSKKSDDSKKSEKTAS